MRGQKLRVQRALATKRRLAISHQDFLFPYCRTGCLTMRFCLFLLFLFTIFSCSIAGDTVTTSGPLRDGQTLVSEGGNFVLGFFNPGSSENKYLGIWYRKFSGSPTYVWVANREKPLRDSSGVLKIGTDGSLVLVDQAGTIFWSSGTSKGSDTVARLLDSGNLELREAGDDDSDHQPLWQSFDYPTDTLLPGMKLGWNLRTGFKWELRSWKSLEDPSPGQFLYEVDPRGVPQSFVWRKNSNSNSSAVVRSGPWFGLPFSGNSDQMYNDIVIFQFTANKDEVFYTYQVKDSSVTMRLILNQLGTLQRLVWVESSKSWNPYWYVPKDQCDYYAGCGAYGVCNSESIFCKCLEGFQSNSQEDLNLRDGSNRCVRREELDCHDDIFKVVSALKLPDTSNSTADMTMNLEQCRDMCLKNCSCVAYAAANYSGGGGCIIWTGDLLDIKEFSSGGQDLYVRLAASEQDPTTDKNGKNELPVAVIVSVTVASGILIALIGFWLMKQKRKRENVKIFASNEDRGGNTDLPLFEIGTIAKATENFSIENRLGKGGFGPVYKGRLEDGQEIAVKRLSRASRQGVDQFINEISLIAKLQHKNLVRLFGFCTQGDERMLIYEYMPNRSLNSFIFNKDKSPLLDWKRRTDIVLGIARGILYLHEDSRLTIIHRDLKASNILLDREMNPKISDFGTARIFKEDQIKDNTTTVVGTYGYMSPEYVLDGIFSMKSDVFSFGVLVLEIMSGRKNRGVFQSEAPLTLLGYVWKLWNEGDCMKLLDQSMGLLEPNLEVLRCIQIGLLCVQERAEDRPKMSEVVVMLGSDITALPEPKKPGFSTTTMAVSSSELDSSAGGQEPCTSVCEITVTVLEGR